MKATDTVFLAPPFLYFFAMLFGSMKEQTYHSISLGMALVAMLLWFVLWLASLVSAVKMEDKGNERMLWIVVILFTNVIGAYLYYFKIMRNEKPPDTNKPVG